MKIDLNTFLIIAGVALIIWAIKGCGGNGGTSDTGQDTIRTETVYRYDTVIHEILTHNISYHDTLIIPQNTDTSAIIRDYFARREFTDSLTDTNISVTYSGAIWKNSLFNPKFTYQILRPQTIIQNTVLETPPRNKISLGLFAGYSKGAYLGASVRLTDKRDRSILVGYGFNQTILFGADWKIQLKKR